MYILVLEDMGGMKAAFLYVEKTGIIFLFWVKETKWILARWQVSINTLLVTSCLQQKQGFTGHPTPVSGTCSLPGSYICAKQHKVVTDGWAIPVKFLLRWINLKDPIESCKCIKMSNNDRNWLRSTITLLLSTMGWDNFRNAKETWYLLLSVRN